MREDATSGSSPHLWRNVLLGCTLALALLLGASTHVGAQETGVIAVDCEGNSLTVETDCQFGDGQEFTVALHVTSPPDGGYFAIQTKLRWDGDTLDYLITDSPVQEVVWPACAIPARTDNRSNDPPDPSVLFACVQFPQDPSEGANVEFTGPVLLFTFRCTAEGTSSLSLIPRESDNQLGSHFIDDQVQFIDGALEGASVTCGGAAVDRPAPEITIRSDDEGTILPDVTPEPPDGPTPGGPTATPGGVQETPTENGDGNGDDDDDGLPVWGWVLIGLAVAGGAGGVGFVAWRRSRSSSEDA